MQKNKMEDEKTKVHVMFLSDEERDRLTKITKRAREVIIEAKTPEEQAFILRVLLETFEKSHNCIIPFKGRYTEPVWNYDKRGLE